MGARWWVRLAGIAAAGLFLAVALGIRLLASGDGILDSSGALQQYSGTALYASMVYAGVFVVAPAARPVPAGAAAVAFCWLVELLQLTGVPARLSEHSVLARMALGVQFDPTDLLWYVAGVLPLVLLQLGLRRLDRRGLNGGGPSGGGPSGGGLNGGGPSGGGPSGGGPSGGGPRRDPRAAGRLGG